MVVGGGWLMKRFGGGRFDSFSKEGSIQLIERKYLSPKTSVWLVEVKNESFVVIDSLNGVAIQKWQKTNNPDV
jgi:flagellar biogenesis protein FliO